MKKIFSIILVLTLVYGMTSCTSDFDEINTNPGAFTSLTNDDAAGLYGKESRFSFLGGDYQLNQGLIRLSPQLGCLSLAMHPDQDGSLFIQNI